MPGPRCRIRIPGHIGKLHKTVVINFDDVPSGTIVDTHYQAQDVTMVSVLAGSGPGGHVYARNSWNIESAPDGVSVVDPSIAVALFDDATGYIELRISLPHRWVSIDAMLAAAPDGFRHITAKPNLEVYDAAGVRLGRASYAPNNSDAAWGTWQQIPLDLGATNIHSERIGSQRDTGCRVYGVFEQLMLSVDLARRKNENGDRFSAAPTPSTTSRGVRLPAALVRLYARDTDHLGPGIKLRLHEPP